MFEIEKPRKHGANSYRSTIYLVRSNPKSNTCAMSKKSTGFFFQVKKIKPRYWKCELRISKSGNFQRNMDGGTTMKEAFGTAITDCNELRSMQSLLTREFSE